jgi:hypothetical protein
MACLIAWCDFSWEAFATLFTGLAAVGGAICVGLKQVAISRRQTAILERQVKLQAQSLRSDRFDRRYRVFEETQNLILGVFGPDGDAPSYETSRPFLTAMGEARFLFDESVVIGLEEIRDRLGQLRVLQKTMQNNYQNDGSYGEGNPQREEDAKLWFSEKLRLLPELFRVMKLND